MKALVVLNPYAGHSPLAKFDAIHSPLRALCDDLRAVITFTPQEVAAHIQQAAADGFDTVITLGGDGSNLTVMNAIMESGTGLHFATIPMGTGRDFARSLAIPLRPVAAVAWIGEATPRLLDVGMVRVADIERYFLNVASAGLSGEVGRRVNSTRVKRPWTFMQATIGTLLQFDAPRMRVRLDGTDWFEGEGFLLAVGNGRYFGRGMKVCPQALLDDGLFDVVLVEGMPKTEVLSALPTIFNGTHLRRDDVQLQRAAHVEVEAMGEPIGLELDGEPTTAQRITFTVRPQALSVLLHQTTAALKENEEGAKEVA